MYGEDAALQAALVHTTVNEATLDIGSILTFVRGRAFAESVAGEIRAFTKPNMLLSGWRVLVYYARAEEYIRILIAKLANDDFRAIVVSTEALGGGKTFPPFRTVISSCDNNRQITQMTMGVVPNSKEGVQQEGDRVARTPFLGPGRHILLRQLAALPDAHAPEIKT